MPFANLLQANETMDVLEYYLPRVDWDQFSQGPLSDDVWAEFQDLILLCHSHKHWEMAVREARREGPGRSMYKEIPYTLRKRRREWVLSIEHSNNHKYRAAFLAAGKICRIASMVQERQGSPDWQFSLALALAVGRHVILNDITGHETAEFGVLAFTAFDGDTEIGNSPENMSEAWRTASALGSVLRVAS